MRPPFVYFSLGQYILLRFEISSFCPLSFIVSSIVYFIWLLNVTSSGFLSSRSLIKTGWRRMPSSVTSEYFTSHTILGFIHVTGEFGFGGSSKGGFAVT